MSAFPPLRIESLAHGGDGVATLPSGKRVFVPGTAPGDLVEAVVVEERPSLVRARMSRLLEPSPLRVAPPCPHALRCGGCQLQHLAAGAQRAAKEQAFYDALERIGGLPHSSIAEALPIVASPADFRYRIRCRLHLRGGALGYLQRGSHELERIESCHLLAPELERLALAVGEALRKRPMAGLREVELCIGEDGAGAIALHPEPGVPAGWASAAPRIFLDGAGIEGLRGIVALPPAQPPGPVSRNRKHAQPPGMTAVAPRIFGDPVVSRPAPLAPGVRLLGRPDVFAQANAAANEALVRAAIDGLDPQPGDRVLELYGGAGNFTFALAARAAHTTVVEYEGEALELARRAAAAAGASAGIRFIAGDAALVVQGFAAEGQRFDLALLDPPRAGARGIARALAALGPRRIAYVSCDPATLARDLGAFLEAGYLALQAVPVDMFPQTFHVEGVVILERGPAWKPAS